MRREPGAADRAATLKAELGALGERLADLRVARGAAQGEVSKEAGAEQRQIAARRAPAIIAAAAERRELAARATELAEQLGGVLREMGLNAEKISAALGYTPNALQFGSFIRRAQSALSISFRYDFRDAREVAARANDPTGRAPQNIGFSAQTICWRWRTALLGPKPTGDLIRHENEVIDGCVPCFADETHAEEARARVAAGGTDTVIVRLPVGAYLLIDPDRLAPDRATAERRAQAAAGDLAVVEHPPGFALVPALFAGSPASVAA